MVWVSSDIPFIHGGIAMINEKLLNVITGLLLFLMMGVICWQLSDGWRPDQIYYRIKPKPVYTNSSYEALEYKYIDAKKTLNTIEGILNDKHDRKTHY